MATQFHASSHGPKSRTARHDPLLGNPLLWVALIA